MTFPASIDGAHQPTDKCGFDRNSSLSEGRYVCMCGWSDPCEWPACDCEKPHCCDGMDALT